MPLQGVGISFVFAADCARGWWLADNCRIIGIYVPFRSRMTTSTISASRRHWLAGDVRSGSVGAGRRPGGYFSTGIFRTGAHRAGCRF